MMTGITRRQILKRTSAALMAFASPIPCVSVTDRNARMLTRPIPSTLEPLPVIGCGTYRTFDVGESRGDRAPLAEVLRVLFAAGGSVIDTSPMYGAAEGVVG